VAKRLLLLADGLLLVAAAFLGVRLYEVWTSRSVTDPRETPPAVAVEAPAPKTATQARPALTEFAGVAERNLFSPTRTETPPEPVRPAAGSSPPPPPAPKPKLYGIVLLSQGGGRAYLEDAQKRRVLAYSVGDLVGDARLEQIRNDRVVLRRGGETFEVLLYDPSKPRQSAAPSSVQSPEAGGVGRPAIGRPPVPGPTPVPGARAPVRPRTVVPPPVPLPDADSPEQPTEEE
jgi:hypothetical protein